MYVQDEKVAEESAQRKGIRVRRAVERGGNEAKTSRKLEVFGRSSAACWERRGGTRTGEEERSEAAAIKREEV